MTDFNTLKQMLIEQTKIPAMQTDPTKTRQNSNILAKHFGAKVHKNYDSNPYSSVHDISHSLDTPNAAKLKDHILSTGWKKKNSINNAKGYTSYAHPQGGAEITIGPDKNGSTHVSTRGTKPAKMGTLPYFD